MNVFQKSLKALREEDHRRALYATLIFAMLMTLFFLLVSMDEPDPPLEEVLIPIDMDNIVLPEEFIEKEEGGGGSQGGANSEYSVTENSADGDESQTEPTVYIPSGNENGNESVVNNPNPEPDKDFGYNGNGGNGNGNGDGDGFGDGDGVDKGDGSGPEGTYNPSRKVTVAPTFSGKAQEEGKIALDIYVDENGKVNHVRYKESKSTSGSAYLIKLATAAAKTMKYDKKPGAGIEHVGYEVFEFRKI